MNGLLLYDMRSTIKFIAFLFNAKTVQGVAFLHLLNNFILIYVHQKQRASNAIYIYAYYEK